MESDGRIEQNFVDWGVNFMPNICRLTRSSLHTTQGDMDENYQKTVQSADGVLDYLKMFF